MLVAAGAARGLARHDADEALHPLHGQIVLIEGNEESWWGSRRGTQAIVWFEVDRPVPRKIPRSVPAIRNLEDLMRFFQVDRVNDLNRSIYRNTDCGASISVQTPDGQWHHNGQDWSNIDEIIAFTIQTIVERSDATVDSDPFELPVTQQEVDDWINDMEQEAHELWQEANMDPEMSPFYEPPPGGPIRRWHPGEEK